MKRFVASLAILAALTDAAFACPVVRQRVVAVAETAVIVTPTVATVATFVPVVVPAYAASYQPSGESAAYAQLIKEHGDRLLTIERFLTTGAVVAPSGGAVGTNPPPSAPVNLPPMPRADVPLDPGAARFAANCMKCHDAAAPKGGVTLFRNGSPVELSCEQALACIGQIASDRMPKGSKLLQEDDGPTLVSWLAKRGKK